MYSAKTRTKWSDEFEPEALLVYEEAFDGGSGIVGRSALVRNFLRGLFFAGARIESVCAL
jgi:hypothetical protein